MKVSSFVNKEPTGKQLARSVGSVGFGLNSKGIDLKWRSKKQRGSVSVSVVANCGEQQVRKELDGKD
ncbi:hypothetical protein [Planktothrix pseudagardhii]|uniref:hypothetical protein n=1 Tax=Planktothrix pseudagardhii TaxID=132604 RepID=UPI0020B1DA89|nr:hypothetical protein [Planktothrix pseudagardhii]